MHGNLFASGYKRQIQCSLGQEGKGFIPLFPVQKKRLRSEPFELAHVLGVEMRNYEAKRKS